MEKERTGVPPGIGPRLPDPPADLKRKPTRRETAIAAVALLLVVVLATCFIVFALGSGRSPMDTVNQGATEMYRVQQEIIQVSLAGSGERYVYFYISSDALSCALLERGAGGYKLLNTWGHLALTAPGKDGTWIAGAMESGRQEFLIFGILYNDAISAVEVDGQRAVVADNGQYRCWYYLGEGALSINPDSIAYK